jgi:rubrerythrin
MGIISVGRFENRFVKGVQMLDEATTRNAGDGDFVEFTATGTSAVGEYHCAACGYGVTVHAALPQCPMCSGTSWEPSAWSPFSRARLQ